MGGNNPTRILGCRYRGDLFFTFVTLAANLLGLVAGEWRGVGSRPLRNLGQGLELLTVASIAIAWAIVSSGGVS